MIQLFKRLFRSLPFIVVFAFGVRMLLLYHIWKVAPVPVRDFVPYGYELGRVARAIAAGQGFSSPLRMVDSGPTVWFTPIYPYLVAAIFKIWGIYSDLSHMIIQTLNLAFAVLNHHPYLQHCAENFRRGCSRRGILVLGFSADILVLPADMDLGHFFDSSVSCAYFLGHSGHA